VKIFDTKRLRVRKLTPKEYGILQAFPMDDWKQVVSDSQAYKQFGNAVTTTVFTAIAEEIAKKHLCSRRKRGTKHGSRKQELYRDE
jgi:site-specific DNA-cytosine methylase